MAISEERMEIIVKNRVISSDFLYNKDDLTMFIKKVGDFSGPFRRSMFVTHSEVLRKFKEVGFQISRNKRNGYYYIIPNIESDPILFDPQLLDI